MRKNPATFRRSGGLDLDLDDTDVDGPDLIQRFTSLPSGCPSFDGNVYAAIPQRCVAIDHQVVERTRRERGVAVLPPLFRFFV